MSKVDFRKSADGDDTRRSRNIALSFWFVPVFVCNEIKANSDKICIKSRYFEKTHSNVLSRLDGSIEYHWGEIVDFSSFCSFPQITATIWAIFMKVYFYSPYTLATSLTEANIPVDV